MPLPFPITVRRGDTVQIVEVITFDLAPPDHSDELEELKRLYYIGKGTHPHDHKIPLDLWNEVSD